MKTFIYKVLVLLVVNLSIYVAQAQSTLNLKKAITFFDKGEYQSVIDELESVLARNDRDIKANYYVGASFVCLNKNIPESIRRLKYAQVKNCVLDSYFYLGRAYQLNSEYELAIQTFDKFLKTAKKESLIALANEYRQQCENSVALASKIFKVRVIDKYRVIRDSILCVYKPSKEVGQIQHNSDFFESDIDPQGILYRTERGDAVYFSLPDGSEKEKLYKIERLLDGWGEMNPLNGLASEGNDMMPIMMTDGTTLYFSSDREGGMGGLDIYRSTYDIESRTFTEPVNMGVPFNSAFDDYLFVADDFQNIAWFASNRETSIDSVMVYEIVWDESVIRSFAQNTEEIRTASMLKIDHSISKKVKIQDAVSATNKQNYSVKKEMKKFDFILNDTLTYTQWEHFRSNDAKVKYSKAYSLQNEKDSLSNVMAEKRKMFMTLSSDEERNKLIGEILKIERSVYSLEDEIDVALNEARALEIKKIEQQVAKGEYVALSSIMVTKKKVSYDWSKILQAENFEMCENTLFEKVRNKNAELYEMMFTPEEQKNLQNADSLYVWAGIMVAESQKLQEKMSSGEVVRIRNDKGNVEEMSMQKIQERRDMLMAASAQLYVEMLDKKFVIVDDKFGEIIEKDKAIDYTEITELRNRAEYEYLRADKSNIDKQIASKREGMKFIEDAMDRYQSHLDGTFPLPEMKQSMLDILENGAKVVEERDELVQKEQIEDLPMKNNEVEINRDEEVKTEVKEEPELQEEKVVLKNDDTKPIYRIQLGAFKNKPAATALQSLKDITSIDVPEKGLTKYYSGSYRKYSEALENLPEVQRLFAGAFIVAFQGDKQIKLSEAQKLE